MRVLVACLGICAALGLCGSLALAAATPSPASPSGTLVLDDRTGLASLIVLDPEGKKQELLQPGPVGRKPPDRSYMRVSPGRYSVVSVNGLDKSHALSALGWEGSFEIPPGGSYELRVPPPTPSVEVHRRGRTLQLDYKLTGFDGSPCVPPRSDQPPRFTVYSGEEEIGSGTFEYG